MRKKSHMDIVRYIKQQSEFGDELNKHKLMLYFGSILPDILPTFLYKRHTIDDTLDILKREIDKVLECREIDGYYCRHIGIISHYVSDYYTLPHNKVYSGSLKEHCRYEGELKLKLREQLYGDESHEGLVEKKQLTGKEIVNLIVKNHREYLNNLESTVYNINNDCRYIISINEYICKLIEYTIMVCYENQRIGILAMG